MRIATKNEILVLLGACVPAFAALCTSPLGAATKFLFDNATSFDLDSELVQGMTAQLNAAGIIDADCLARFTAFGADASPTAPRTYRTYRAPVDDSIPEGAVSVPDSTDPTQQIITVEVSA